MGYLMILGITILKNFMVGDMRVFMCSCVYRQLLPPPPPTRKLSVTLILRDQSYKQFHRFLPNLGESAIMHAFLRAQRSPG